MVINSDMTDDEAPNLVPGKWVLAALVVLAVTSVGLAVTLIRPIEGAAPAAPEDRPFGRPTTRPYGPATADDLPLIHRNANLEGIRAPQ